MPRLGAAPRRLLLPLAMLALAACKSGPPTGPGASTSPGAAPSASASGTPMVSASAAPPSEVPASASAAPTPSPSPVPSPSPTPTATPSPTPSPSPTPAFPPIEALQAFHNVTSIAGQVGQASASGVDGDESLAVGTGVVTGIAVDDTDQVYLGINSHVIRTVTPELDRVIINGPNSETHYTYRRIKTFAGALGQPGQLPAQGSSLLDARLNSPGGLYFGPDHALYFTTPADHRVWKIVGGLITLVAGSGLATEANLQTDPRANQDNKNPDIVDRVLLTGDGEPATSASLTSPSAVTAGPDGTLYIADTGNSRIRHIRKDGRMESICGGEEPGRTGDGGPAIKARLERPNALAFDRAGNLYVTDDSHRIRRIDTKGLINTVAGVGYSGFNGDHLRPLETVLNTPTGLTLGPDGAIYFSDSANHVIRRYRPGDDAIEIVAGISIKRDVLENQEASGAYLGRPTVMAFGPKHHFYVFDAENYVVHIIQLSAP